MIPHLKYLGVSEIIKIGNCIDTDYFVSNLDVEKQFVMSIFSEKDDVLRLKRGLNFIKSLPSIIKLFPDIKFLVVGCDINNNGELNKLIIDLKLSSNILFVPKLHYIKLREFYQKSYVFVQVSDIETFGVSIGEAMSCEVPVVVSSAGAIPELVGEYGVYVDHNSVESISGGVINLLELSIEERKNIGGKLRQRIVENYTVEIRKKSLEKLFNRYVKCVG